MLEKTEGIVLNYLRYRETSIIVRIYTEKFGLRSYIINGVRSRKSKKGIGLFQPFTILDTVVYHNQKKSISRLAEYKNAHSLSNLHFNVIKSSVTLFLTEILIKTLHEHFEEDHQLYYFLRESVILFDQLDEGYENFHLYFLIRYMKFLGFGIYDMDHLDEEGDKPLVAFLNDAANPARFPYIKANKHRRREALDLILRYYRTHLDNLGKIKSLEIMYQIFE